MTELLRVTQQTYVDNPIVQTYDGNQDGIQEIVYLTPQAGQSFEQILRIENTGPVTANHAELIVTTAGSPYVDLSQIRLGQTNDPDVTIQVERLNADQIKVIVNGLDQQPTGQVDQTLNQASHQPSDQPSQTQDWAKYLDLVVTSTIVNPEEAEQADRLTPEPLTFNLQADNDPETADFGNTSVEATVFFSEAGFSTDVSTLTDQRTVFRFAPFADSQLQVDFVSPSSVDYQGQAAQVVRAAGSFVGQDGETRHLVLFDLTGDLDLITRSRGGTKSIPKDIILTLVWTSDLVLPIAPFSGLDPQDYQTFLTTYVDGGYFDATFATDERKGVIGQIEAFDPVTGQSLFTQPARSGDLGDTSPPSLDQVLYGTSVAELLEGGSGNDTLYGNGGNDTLVGGSGDDWIYGGPQADRILGGSGNDVIYANGDPDRIEAGPGLDTIWLGGGGTSTIGLTPGEGYSTVYNFQPGATRLQVNSTSDLSFVDSGAGAQIFQNDDLLAIVTWQSASLFTSNLTQIFVTEPTI